MSDFILVDGDKALFMSFFEDAMVWGPAGKIKGSGPALLNGKKICIVGDEASVKVDGCQYLTPTYSIPGQGTLTISKLADDQKAQKTTTGSTAVILKGSMFEAEFKVDSPAQQPPPGPGGPTPDSKKKYAGQGMFITTNRKFTGV